MEMDLNGETLEVCLDDGRKWRGEEERLVTLLALDGNIE